jgi:putative FmdB family regulatory protein
MPTYDYKCDACEHTFEKFQSIKAPLLRKCPKCGKAKLRRLIGIGAAVIFKGSGLYQTDYRSPTYSKAAEADKSASSSTPAAASSTDGGKGAAAGEKAPAAKAEPAAAKTGSAAKPSAKSKAAG